MHETRNFILVLVMVGSIVWALVAWLLLSPQTHALAGPQRVMSTLVAAASALWLVYAMKFQDRLPDHLRGVCGGFYYEADGLSFMPVVRVRGGQAELCVFYQNRHENPAEAIIHLRPPGEGESFVIEPGVRDVHFAFRADGGDFGVIHQPIAVPRHLQGSVVDVQMAAASWFPRSKGALLRRTAGLPCGTLLVDWVGNPLKIGVHEVSGELPLHNPVTLHLAMPVNVPEELERTDIWRQEHLAVGA